MEEQNLIESLIEGAKPPMPIDCAGIHYLRATPFRYKPTHPGSRFRRSDHHQGVFYAAEHVETCVAEVAFYRLLFFAESPDTVLPSNPVAFTAFQVGCETDAMIDLSLPPLAEDSAIWMQLTDYSGCQRLADAARQAGAEIIRYISVRDPEGRANVALLTPQAFPENERARDPVVMQTWHLFVRATGVQASREFPKAALEYSLSSFSKDDRLLPLVVA